MTLGQPHQAEFGYISWTDKIPVGPVRIEDGVGASSPDLSHTTGLPSQEGPLDMAVLNTKNNITVSVWAGNHHC